MPEKWQFIKLYQGLMREVGSLRFVRRLYLRLLLKAPFSLKIRNRFKQWFEVVSLLGMVDVI